jgi:hypothetical protein
MSLIVARHRVIICLLFLVSLVPQALLPAAGAQGTSGPLLTLAGAVALPSGLVAVEGHGFNAGGLVSLVVYDQRSAEVHEHVWTVATTAHFGPNGSADPAQGYVPAGTINEVIDIFPNTVCGQDLIVQAYDHQAAAWSNLLDISTAISNSSCGPEWEGPPMPDRPGHHPY